MADKKISQLNITTTADDNSWLVMNDSGNTATFRIKRSDLLSGTSSPSVYQEGTGTDSITPSYLAAGSVSAGSFNTISGGDGNTIDATGPNNIISGGYQNTLNSTSTDGCNSILGGYASTISGSGGVGSIIASNATISSGGLYNSIIGAAASTIGGGSRNLVAGGVYLDMNQGDNSVLLGGNNNDINAGTSMAIVGGQSNLIANYGQTGGIFVSENCEVLGYKTFVIGGENNKFTNDSRFTNMIGGFGNRINGNNSQGLSIINSWQSSTNGSGAERHLIINSDLCSTTGSSYTNKHATIMSSTNCGIGADRERAVLIGLSGKQALYSATTQVDNIHTHRTETFDVVAAGNVGGNIDVDCSLGTIFTFTMTANTTPNFINIRTGQRFIFIVENNASWSVPTATVNGVSSTVYAKNGTLNPTNAGFTKYTATYANGILWLDEELAFQAV